MVNQLKLGPLLAAPMQAAAQQQSQQTGDGLPARLERGMLSFTAWAQGPVNSYGGPYMFVHWCTGLLTVSMTTAAVHHGLDITAVLSSVPYLAFDESSVQFVSGQASCVAGVLFNTLSLPVRLYLLSLYGKPAFAALERQHAALALAIRSHHRKQLRGDPSLQAGASGEPWVLRQYHQPQQRSAPVAGGDDCSVVSSQSQLSSSRAAVACGPWAPSLLQLLFPVPSARPRLTSRRLWHSRLCSYETNLYLTTSLYRSHTTFTLSYTSRIHS